MNQCYRCGKSGVDTEGNYTPLYAVLIGGETVIVAVLEGNPSHIA